MLHIVRGGPRIMLLTGDEAKIASLIRSSFSCTGRTLEETVERAGEGQSVVLFRGGAKGVRRFILAEAAPDEILALLLNSGGEYLPKTVRLMPRLIFFRVFGEKERVIGQIEKDFQAENKRLKSVLGPAEKDSIAVCFTAKPLNRPLAIRDITDEVLHVRGVSFEKLLDSLRSRALWYFTEGLEDRRWNELEIRIYDSWGDYSSHCDRLRIVIDSLDAGMVLGEGWGKDYAHILMAVRVYRFNFYTFLPPAQIKEMLMGLEYDAAGERLADFDLYGGRDKISWGGVADKSGGRQDRTTLGRSFREKLFSMIQPDDINRLEDLEKQIKERRKGGGAPV